ncbi:unnamed protein product, partial [Hymenolepis diminuta]
MRVIFVLSFALPLLAYRTEDSCLKMPESKRVSSICSRFLDLNTVRLIMNLEKDVYTSKTHLRCMNGPSKIYDIKDEGDENIYELKYIDLRFPLGCRLSVNFSWDRPDIEDLHFSLNMGQLIDLSSNLLDNQGRDATEWYGGTESTEDMYGTEITGENVQIFENCVLVKTFLLCF